MRKDRAMARRASLRPADVVIETPAHIYWPWPRDPGLGHVVAVQLRAGGSRIMAMLVLNMPCRTLAVRRAAMR
jgi:hypothetical protein